MFSAVFQTDFNVFLNTITKNTPIFTCMEQNCHHFSPIYSADGEEYRNASWMLKWDSRCVLNHNCPVLWLRGAYCSNSHILKSFSWCHCTTWTHVEIHPWPNMKDFASVFVFLNATICWQVQINFNGLFFYNN